MTKYTKVQNDDGTFEYRKVKDNKTPNKQKELPTGTCTIMKTPNNFGVKTGYQRTDNPYRS